MNLQKIIRILIIAIVLMAAFSLLGIVTDIAQVLLWAGLKIILLLLIAFIVLNILQALVKSRAQ